jgi:putative transcriptional regulator
MIKLRIKEILEQKGRSKYWLYKQMGMSYQNFNKLINNETSSIKYTNLETICDILECTPGDLFDYKTEEI